VHTLIHVVVPGILGGLVVLAVSWRSQTIAFVALLLLLVGANSNITWIQDVCLPARWGGLSAVALSVVWTFPLRWRARPQRGLGVVLAVFVLYALVSTIWSASPHWTLMRTVSFGVLLWAVFAGVRPSLSDPDEGRRLARGVVALLVIVVGASLLYWAVDRDGAVTAGQFRGVFLNPAYLALLVGLTYPLVLAQFESLSPRRYVVLSAIGTLLCIVVISFCQSRAGLAAFVLAVLAYEAARGRMRRLLAPAAALAIVVVVFQFWQPPIGSAGSTFISPGRLIVGPKAPGQSRFSALVSGRDEVWSATTDLISRKPAAGYGFGTGDRLLKGRKFRHFVGFSPHNAYLQALLELGVVGTLLLLAPLALGLRRVAAGLRSRSVPPEIAAFGAVLVGGLCDGIFEDVFEAAGSPFAPLIWLSCAVVLVRVRQRAAATAPAAQAAAAERIGAAYRSAS
jgi:O-antigen ligase